MDSKEEILERYFLILDSLKAYPESKLVAVSKRQDLEKIQVLVEAGHLDFGENYLQEWEGKKEHLPAEIHWHFIGQVQSRKVKPMVEAGVYSIHSLGSNSSIKKWRALDHRPKGPCFIQVNLEGEVQKGGLSEEETRALHGEGQLEHIQGLMTIPPFGLEPQVLRKHFQKMRALSDDLGFKELSMGMSSDWKMALEEGSTSIRVGTGLFGRRKDKI